MNESAKKILHEIIRTRNGEQAGVKPEEALLGKWQNIGHKETIEFFKDGSVNFLSDDHSPMGGDYKIIDDSHVRMSLGGFAGLAGPTVWKFSVSRDQLTLTLPDGTVALYRKVK
jgi:hypothetical protein